MNILLKSVLVGVLWFISVLQVVPVLGVIGFVFLQIRDTALTILRTNPRAMDQALVPYSIALMAVGFFIAVVVLPIIGRNHQNLMKARDLIKGL